MTRMLIVLLTALATATSALASTVYEDDIMLDSVDRGNAYIIDFDNNTGEGRGNVDASALSYACNGSYSRYLQIRILWDLDGDGDIDREDPADYQNGVICSNNVLDNYDNIFQCGIGVQTDYGAVNVAYTVSSGGSVVYFKEWNVKTSNGLGMPEIDHPVTSNYGCAEGSVLEDLEEELLH